MAEGWGCWSKAGEQVKTLVVLMLAMLPLAGCSSTKTDWVQPGADEMQFKCDNYECMRDSRTSWSGAGVDAIIAQNSAKDQARRLYRSAW